MKSTIITIPPTFQGCCPYCLRGMFDFRPIVVREGLKCDFCRKTTPYDWTEMEFQNAKKRHNQ